MEICGFGGTALVVFIISQFKFLSSIVSTILRHFQKMFSQVFGELILVLELSLLSIDYHLREYIIDLIGLNFLLSFKMDVMLRLL